jgi:nitrite reductase/ring-hydroxylating ferredoxin subunit
MATSDNFCPLPRREKFRKRKSVAGIGDVGWIDRISFVTLNQTPPFTSSRANESCMPTCEVCENEYDKAFEVVMGGERHTFDSFECAIHALAPVCPHCNCRIVGHGVEADGKIFCCVHCARASGTTQLKDRV